MKRKKITALCTEHSSTHSHQPPVDDGKKHPIVTPQATSSGRYLIRKRRRPGYLKDYTQDESDEDDSTLISVDYCYRAVSGIPLTFKEAMASTESERWKKAMDKEIQSLEENHTFTLTTLPEGRKTVGGRWVYAIKKDSDGHYQYIARLVAKGYSQSLGIDYGETFSRTASLTSVRVALQKAAQDNSILL